MPPARLEATAHRLRLTMEEAKRIFGDYVPGDWSHDAVGKDALVIREPIGVVAVNLSLQLSTGT